MGTDFIDFLNYPIRHGQCSEQVPLQHMSGVQAKKLYTPLKIAGGPKRIRLMRMGYHHVGGYGFISSFTICAGADPTVLGVVQLPTHQEFLWGIRSQDPILYRECVEP